MSLTYTTYADVLAGIGNGLLRSYEHDFKRIDEILTRLALGPCDAELTGDDRVTLLVAAALAREKAAEESDE